MYPGNFARQDCVDWNSVASSACLLVLKREDNVDLVCSVHLSALQGRAGCLVAVLVCSVYVSPLSAGRSCSHQAPASLLGFSPNDMRNLWCVHAVNFCEVIF